MLIVHTLVYVVLVILILVVVLILMIVILILATTVAHVLTELMDLSVPVLLAMMVQPVLR